MFVPRLRALADLSPGRVRAFFRRLWPRAVAALTLFAATGCHLWRTPAEREMTRREVVETVRDTLVIVEPDSALIRAYLECQSGRVALSRLISVPGARIVPRMTLTDILTDTGYRGALLDVQCHEDSLRRVIALRDRTIRELRDRVRTEYVTVERPFRWHHRALMAGGWAFLALVLGMAAWLAIRFIR
ncbi:hypothetical protein BHU11_09965 [Tannerella sp. oral taxon 808]|nr:hypothetical protein BHU11_09965 [Tannerella sp. oral taxon 808]